MAIGITKESLLLEDILNRVSEIQILNYYLGISNIPTIINSPLREDRKPSFGLYSPDGKRIFYKDMSTKDTGSLFDLLIGMWGKSFNEVLEIINKDIGNMTNSFGKIDSSNTYNITPANKHRSKTELQCKIRDWESYDIEYWNSYGVSIEWLKYAEVYPISHKIILKDNNKYIFKADKYAYAYVEHKENKVTLKIYQPFNTKGFKWSNKHDTSVISLWTKVPKEGDSIVICSSLKDALCLWSNIGIPALAIQGEGYNISNTAISELKRRYKKIYILFDNDSAGIIDSKKLTESTGFINITLPIINGAKDISDLYLSLKDKTQFKKIILNLFNT